MQPIYVAAWVTFAFAATVFVGAILMASRRELRPLLLALVAVQLPMAWLAYHVVRMPLLDEAVRALLDPGRSVYVWIRLLYAPLTEEPAKLWPLLLPLVSRRLEVRDLGVAAAAVGVGFGLGEIFLVAEFVAAEPSFAAIPWHEFSGFMSERTTVCLVHGGFTGAALLVWRRWGWGLGAGLAAAMALHLLGNLPILLAARGWFGSDPMVRGIVLQLWIAGFFVLAIMILVRLHRPGAGMRDALLGEATCPRCRTTYRRPWLAVNLGWKRFERCPACRSWNVV